MTGGFCTHLKVCMMVADEKNRAWFECTCQEDMAAGCIPSEGVDHLLCPVWIEIKKRIKDYSFALSLEEVKKNERKT